MNAWGNFSQRWRKRWSEDKGDVAVFSSVLVVVLLAVIALQASELRQRYPVITWGSVSDAFAAVGTISAVIVALWQSVVIRRQAKDSAKEAADRFEDEIKAASARTRQEVDAAEQRSQREQQAAAERHEAELEVQREVARTQRVHLREQEFKLALIRVSRAASAYTHELATMVEQTGRVVNMPTRQERADALRPISKKLGALAEDLSVEISGAHMLTNNDELHNALDAVNAAAMSGPLSESNFRNTVIMEGQDPDYTPIFMLMERLHRVIGDARRMAAELLLTGWD